MSVADLMRRHQGDTATWRWELDDDPAAAITGWDEATLFGQVRAGVGPSARLIATSNAANILDDAGGMHFTGTDLAAGTPVLSWTVDLDAVAPGTYVLEVQVEVNGGVETVFSELLVVLAQTAVAS
jgi:hypothetical protein